MARRLLVIVILALGVLAATGSATARTPHDTSYRPVASDVRTAKSLLVVRADMPGFRDAGAPQAADVTCSTYDPDLSGLVTTGEAEGRYFTRKSQSGLLTIGSEAALFRSAAHANKYWARAVVSRKIAPCLSELFGDGLPSGARLTNLRTVPIKASTGPLRIQSWNLVGNLQTANGAAPFVLEAVGMKRGRAISFVVAVSIGQPMVNQVRRVGAVASAKLMRASLGAGVAAA